MTHNEKEALLGYLEFHLLTFCEQLEGRVDVGAIGDLYDTAYGILIDMESTLETHRELTGKPREIKR